MRQLGAIDADMLYAETAASHLHVGALLVLDPSSAPLGFGLEAWKRLVEAHVEHLPPLRQRLVEVPLGLDRPWWVEDEHFHVDRHVRRVAVPAPGGPRELAALVSDLSSYKLDRSGPLWEMWYVEGLAEERVAVLFRIHHACVDGMAGALMLGRILTPDASTAPPPARPVAFGPHAPRERIPSNAELVWRSLPALAATPLRAARTLRHTVASVREVLRLRASPAWTGTPLPFHAPRTSLNQPVTPRRSFAFASVPIADVKELKRALDVKVNDVVLALCAGALRRYLVARGELPREPLVAAVPVSVRSGEELDGFGNVVSGMFATLATHVDDPVARVRAIAEGAARAKQLFTSGVENAAMEWAGVASPGVVAVASRLASVLDVSARMPLPFNLLVSNVPGPPVSLYAAGARLEACYPMGPVLGNVGLNITVLSHGERVDFGLLSCPDVVPDLAQIAHGIPEALAELRAAVEAHA